MSGPSYLPPPPPRAPVPTGPAPTRRPTGLVIAVLCLTAALLGVIGAALLFGDDARTAADADPPDVVDAPAPARTGDVGEQVDTGPDEAGSENERTRAPRPTGPTEPVQDAAAAYRCWDGRNVASGADCASQPEGIRGLYWVFPSASGCSRMPAHGRVTYVECTLIAASGGAVEVHYSEWETTAAGHRHYADGKVRKTMRWRGLLRWDLVAQSGSHRFKSALMYPRAPWSVTVYGSSDADRDEVLTRLQWRAPRDLRGTSLR